MAGSVLSFESPSIIRCSMLAYVWFATDNSTVSMDNPVFKVGVITVIFGGIISGNN
jgi:hypothetical protein